MCLQNLNLFTQNEMMTQKTYTKLILVKCYIISMFQMIMIIMIKDNAYGS